jgi:hypothetical protein
VLVVICRNGSIVLLLDDDDVEASAEAPGFAEEMVSEERAGRTAADDGDAVAVLKDR